MKARRASRQFLALALVAATTLAFGAVPALADPADDATVEASDFTLSFNNDGGTDAFCPRGTTATGGGFGTITPPPLNVAINVSAPVNKTGLPSLTRTGDRAREWLVSVYSGVADTIDMRAFAICSTSSLARLRVATFSVPSSKTRSKVVSCPKRQRALGGGLGLATAPISGVYEEGSGPVSKDKTVNGTSTGDSPRAWRVAAYNGFPATRKFQALVICSKTTAPHIVASQVPVAPNTDVHVASNCPAGQRALGGGILVLGKPTPELQFVENGPLGVAGTTAGTLDGSVPVAWDGDVYNRTNTTRSYKTLAVCA